MRKGCGLLRFVRQLRNITSSPHRCVSRLKFRMVRPKPPSKDAEAALHDAGCGFELRDSAAWLSVDGTRQAKSQGRERAAGAQQLRALRVVAAPRLQRRELERAWRQREREWRRRLQVMRAHAAEVEDGASGSGAQDERRDVTKLLFTDLREE